MPRVFLYQGATSFPDPGDWNSFDNTVDCIGSGGAGDVGNRQPGGGDGYFFATQRTVRHGASGGGGAFARGARLTPAFPVPVGIPPPNTPFAGPAAYTFFGGTTQVPGNVIAGCGQNAETTQTIHAGGILYEGGGPHGNLAYPLGYLGGRGGYGRFMTVTFFQTAPTAASRSSTRDAAGGGGSGGPGAHGAGGGAIGPSVRYAAYGGAPNAVVLAAENNPLSQFSPSATGLVDYIYGDGLHGVGGGGGGGAQVIVSGSAPTGSPGPITHDGGLAMDELWWDGTTLRRWDESEGGWIVRPGSFAVGSLNGGNGAAYGGGGGGAGRTFGGFFDPDYDGVPGSGAPGLIVITWTSYTPPPPGEIPPGWARVFLTGQGSWNPPDDWDGMGLVVECVGAGGIGGTGTRTMGDDYGGGGGGGGAYAVGGRYDQIVSDLIPLPIPAPYFVSAVAGGAVNFGVMSGTPSTVRGCVSAQNGAAGGPAGTGAGGAAFSPGGYPGGDGGARPGYVARGSGGGGAAGPNGPGSAGAVAAGTLAGLGGAADGNNVVGGTSGTQWITHGVGGGGMGGGAGSIGNVGAPYGGGGGGGSGNNLVGGASGPGLIIVTYKLIVPEAEITDGQTQIMA